MKALAKDPRYQVPRQTTRAAREIMAFIQQRLTAIRAKLPRAFNTLVRGNVEVRRLPPEEEPGAPGAYGGAGSIDGTIPGKFWINLSTTELAPQVQPADLVHHEAIPGPRLAGRICQQAAADPHPARFNAYSEGWALYAEQLVDELGVYDGDPGRPPRLSPVDRLPRAAGWSSTPASTPSAGPASRASILRRAATARTRWKSPAKSTAIAAGPARPAATRSATARSTACATRRRRRSGSTLRPARRSTSGRARRQRPDGRARQERRRLYRPGEGSSSPSPASRLPPGSRRASGLRARSAAPSRGQDVSWNARSSNFGPSFASASARSRRIVSSPSL